jgi:UDP:flavonoid glycosyltransferase YjiC (YdhE family)
MITNGDYNGVQITLANGVPLVGAGMSEDKAEVNNRIAWSGVGINLKTATPSPEQIRAAVREILGNQKYRQKAKQIQIEMSFYNAPEMSVALLEQLAITKQPITSNLPKQVVVQS